MSDSSLAARVSAPATLPPIELEGVTWRPTVLDDVDALVEVGRLIAMADHPDWSDTREDLLEELGHSYTELSDDSIVGVSDSGDLVAWGLVVMPSHHDTLIRVILLGGVIPSHRDRGIGRALLAWQHGRALQRLAGSPSILPGWIIVAADERAPAAAHTIERAGFTPKRWLQNLARNTGEPLPTEAAAEGIRIVGYSSEHSASAHQVRDDSFSGEGSSQPMSDEQWESMTTLSTFAHEFSFVALDAHNSVIALLLTLVTEEESHQDEGSSGYVWVLGVVPDHRRRGIARALLASHLRSLADAGIARSVLDVATDGPGQGLSLFTDLGYEGQSTSINYVRVY